MSKLSVKGGTTSLALLVFVQDSSQTDGRGLTGLAWNTASLVASYCRPGAARVAITLATQTVTGAYSSGGFVEVDATNMPGLYRFDPPDAALAAGRSCVVILKGATNMVPVVLEIDLAGEGVDLAASLLDLANGVETGYTVRQALRLIAAAVAGKVSGGPTAPVFRDLADAANRISATTDANGNRSVVTHTP